MFIEDRVLSFTERLTFALRALYSRYGYVPYRMSKFEEYDLYSKNKDFLISDSVITFTDIGGRLMALKPDVTLSIIKNNADGSTKKLYYNENVYRVSKGTGSFKEIMQAGVECIGDIDSYQVGESLYLAAMSLAEISSDFVLDISSLDILGAFIDGLSDSRTVQDSLIKCVSEKNTHGILAVCEKNEIDPSLAEPLISLVMLSGAPDTIRGRLETLCEGVGCMAALEELYSSLAVFGAGELKDKINIDFSVVSDRGYYNGVIFKGFVNGIPDSVLSGGRYDKLMRRMKRRSGAVGFAVYLDMLERMDGADDGCDVDTLILYDDKTAPAELMAAVEKASQKGSVRAARDEDSALRFKRVWEV